jgi:hypothetical protein
MGAVSSAAGLRNARESKPLTSPQLATPVPARSAFRRIEFSNLLFRGRKRGANDIEGVVKPLEFGATSQWSEVKIRIEATEQGIVFADRHCEQPDCLIAIAGLPPGCQGERTGGPEERFGGIIE